MDEVVLLRLSIRRLLQRRPFFSVIGPSEPAWHERRNDDSGSVPGILQIAIVGAKNNRRLIVVLLRTGVVPHLARPMSPTPVGSETISFGSWRIAPARMVTVGRLIVEMGDAEPTARLTASADGLVAVVSPLPVVKTRPTVAAADSASPTTTSG